MSGTLEQDHSVRPARRTRRLVGLTCLLLAVVAGAYVLSHPTRDSPKGAPDPAAAEASDLAGMAALAAGQAEVAIPSFQRAIALSPQTAAFHAHLAEALEQQSRFTDAAAECRQAVALDPVSPEYRTMLGLALATGPGARQEYLDAVEALKAALEDAPGDFRLRFSLGTLHERFGEMDSARRELEQCVALKPRNVDVWYNLAVVYGRLADETSARAAMQRYQQLTDQDQTAVALERNVAAAPSDASLRVKLAEAYRRSGRPNKGLKEMQAAAQLRPGDPAIAGRLKAYEDSMKARQNP